MKLRLLNTVLFDLLSNNKPTESIRFGVRGIIKNDAQQLLIVSLQSNKELLYKLPGGGILKGESAEDALKREILEECGYKLSQIGYLGCTLNHVKDWNAFHVNYIFGAKVTTKSKRKLTTLEKGQELECHWMEKGEAIAKIELMSNSTYGRLIKERDYQILNGCG